MLRLNDDGGAVRDDPAPSRVIFGGLHRPAALGWLEQSDRLWVVDEAPPAPSPDPSRRPAVSVRALADVSSACVYRGTRFPLLANTVLVAAKDSVRYIDHAPDATYESRFLLSPDVGRIQVVQADENGFLYLGTGNTRSTQEVGRDVLIRVSPRPHGAVGPPRSPLPAR